MIDPRGSALRFFFRACTGACLCSVASCGPAPDTADERGKPGTLLLGNRAALDGTEYLLEARFDVNGPQICTLDTREAIAPVQRDLSPGQYLIAIQSDFLVFEDVAIAEVPIASSLSSEPTQPFEIRSGAPTRVEFRFIVTEGEVSFVAE